MPSARAIRLAAGLALAVALARPAAAEEGCGKFAWPLMHDKQLFMAAGRLDAKAGDRLVAGPEGAVGLHLAPAAAATFTLPPERTPRATAGYGGMLMLPPPERPGIYQVTLSDEAWVDLVQSGRYAHAVGSTGRSDCPGLRKSVRFEVAAEPIALQISGVAAPVVTLTVGPPP